MGKKKGITTQKPYKNEKIEKKRIKVLTNITPYLALPQKIAAAKLGVTVSLLGRKFKEATERKWPFRYLHKLDSEMKETKSAREYERLSKIKKELLAPLSIYLHKNNKKK